MKNNKGSILLEMLTSGFVAISFCLGVSTMSLLFFAKQLQQIEIFFLARSQLYGNTTECQPRMSLWPPLKGLHIVHRCFQPGKIEAEFGLGNHTFFHSQINLMEP